MADTIQEVIDKFVLPVTESGCWLWMGAGHPLGYGAVIFQKRRWAAHRLFYITFKGPIPKGFSIDHLCRIPACVNPRHLEAVTHQENMRRGLTGVLRVPQTHCKRGHPLSGDNVRRHPTTGCRICRTCRRLNAGWKGKSANSKRTHCPRGHPYSEENTYINPRGQRVCRECYRGHQRAYRARNYVTPKIPWTKNRTHCPQGHPYDETNTYHKPNGGGRICRECHRIKARLRSLRKSAHHKTVLEDEHVA